MAILGIDLGGTKLAMALFADSGELLLRETRQLGARKGAEVARLIQDELKRHMASSEIDGVGVSVPGISRQKTGTVWAPNIEGWKDYPLLRELSEVAGTTPVTIDNDRACSILGEQWKGTAKGCKDAIFIASDRNWGCPEEGNLRRGSTIRGAIDAGIAEAFERKCPCAVLIFYASETCTEICGEVWIGSYGFCARITTSNLPRHVSNLRRQPLRKNHRECYPLGIAAVTSAHFNPEN